MGKDMTFFLFIGMFKGLIDQTKAFRKEEDAEFAFYEFTALDWGEVCLNEKTCEELAYGSFGGSVIIELQIEP